MKNCEPAKDLIAHTNIFCVIVTMYRNKADVGKYNFLTLSI